MKLAKPVQQQPQRKIRIDRVIEIDPQFHRQIRVLFDRINSKPDGQQLTDAYDLWTLIAEQHPEVMTGEWNIEFIGPFRVRVVEYVTITD